MKTFFDCYGNKVELSFSFHSFQEDVKHVLVVCEYGDDWLLTDHKTRGLEFPGGKIEPGESLEQAARREAYEETGALLSELIYLGEYRVTDTERVFVKAVYWGKVECIEKKKDYLETNGPITVKGDLLQQRFGEEYSFIMKDQVIEECLNRLDDIKNKKNSGTYFS